MLLKCCGSAAHLVERLGSDCQAWTVSDNTRLGPCDWPMCWCLGMDGALQQRRLVTM